MIRPYKLITEDNVENPNLSGKWDGNEKFKNNIRSYLRVEQKLCCAYCKMPILYDHKSSRHIEHIIPKDLNSRFMFEPKNLVMSCSQCNSTKKDQEVYGNRGSRILKNYPKNSSNFLIYHPIYDNFEDFFTVEENMIILPVPGINNTKAKKTIKVCGLDRIELIIERYQYCEFFKGSNETSELLASILKVKNNSELNLLVEKLEKDVIEIIHHDEIKGHVCT